MNLLALANFICGKVSQSAAEDVLACKGFLQRRFEMLWQDQLWKESLVQYTQTISKTGYTPTSTWLPTKQVLLLPPNIERVLAMRTGDRHLNVQSQPHYFRMDFDAFQQSGAPVEFVNLPRAVWEFDTAQSLYLLTSAADAEAKLAVDLLAADGATINRVQVQGGATGNVALGASDLVANLLKGQTQGDVTLSVGTTATLHNGAPYIVIFYLYKAGVAVGTQLVTGNSTVQINLSGPQADSISPRIGVAATAIPGGAGFIGLIDYAWPSAAFSFSSSQAGAVLVLAAAATAAPQRCRIKLIGVPDDGTVLRILGKSAAPAFSNDNDEPGLSGVANCLIAFAQADMLQRERQYSKAQALQQEAQALLDQFKRQEVVQQAHHQRIIPEDGYGNPYDMWAHPPLTF